MFHFQSTTLINSDKDFRSEKARFSSLSEDEKHGAILRIKRDYTFEMPGILKVYKKVATTPVKAKLSVDCDALLNALPKDTVYPVTGRLAMYIALEGSEESTFANDFYQKGRPMSIGFIVRSEETASADLAKEIKRIAAKFNLATVGRKLVDVSVNGSTVTFECTDEYMRFKGMAVLLDNGDSEQEVAHFFDGENPDDNTQDVITLDERGVNGFGTFRHIVKDLRLPTAMNTGWTALQQTERPVPGALYNQYTIHYKAPSYTNPSLVAVGHETMSKTTHMFWVRQELAEAFEKVIAEVVGSDAVKNDRTAIFEEVE